MLNHGVYLQSKTCRLRPLLDEDEDNVLALWNQDFVVGKLYMSKTSHETYQRFFEIYKTNPKEWRWVIEDCEGNFIGTTSRTQVDNEIFTSGSFALYPTEAFLPTVPMILVNNFIFQQFNAQKVTFTVVSTNKRMKKIHQILRAINTGKETVKTGSNGQRIILEHWEYVKREWEKHQAFYDAMCS